MCGHDDEGRTKESGADARILATKTPLKSCMTKENVAGKSRVTFAENQAAVFDCSRPANVGMTPLLEESKKVTTMSEDSNKENEGSEGNVTCDELPGDKDDPMDLEASVPSPEDEATSKQNTREDERKRGADGVSSSKKRRKNCGPKCSVGAPDGQRVRADGGKGGDDAEASAVVPFSGNGMQKHDTMDIHRTAKASSVKKRTSKKARYGVGGAEARAVSLNFFQRNAQCASKLKGASSEDPSSIGTSNPVASHDEQSATSKGHHRSWCNENEGSGNTMGRKSSCDAVVRGEVPHPGSDKIVAEGRANGSAFVTLSTLGAPADGNLQLGESTPKAASMPEGSVGTPGSQISAEKLQQQAVLIGGRKSGVQQEGTMTNAQRCMQVQGKAAEGQMMTDAVGGAETEQSALSTAAMKEKISETCSLSPSPSPGKKISRGKSEEGASKITERHEDEERPSVARRSLAECRHGGSPSRTARLASASINQSNAPMTDGGESVPDASEGAVFLPSSKSAPNRGPETCGSDPPSAQPETADSFAADARSAASANQGQNKFGRNDGLTESEVCAAGIKPGLDPNNSGVSRPDTRLGEMESSGMSWTDKAGADGWRGCDVLDERGPAASERERGSTCEQPSRDEYVMTSFSLPKDHPAHDEEGIKAFFNKASVDVSGIAGSTSSNELLLDDDFLKSPRELAKASATRPSVCSQDESGLEINSAKKWNSKKSKEESYVHKKPAKAQAISPNLFRRTALCTSKVKGGESVPDALKCAPNLGPETYGSDPPSAQPETADSFAADAQSVASANQGQNYWGRNDRDADAQILAAETLLKSCMAKKKNAAKSQPRLTFTHNKAAEFDDERPANKMVPLEDNVVQKFFSNEEKKVEDTPYDEETKRNIAKLA